MFPKDQLIPRLPGPKRPGWYWRIAVPLLAICTLAIGTAPALAAPGGEAAVPSTMGPFELKNTVTTLCLTDEGYGFVDTEACTAGDKGTAVATERMDWSHPPLDQSEERAVPGERQLRRRLRQPPHGTVHKGLRLSGVG